MISSYILASRFDGVLIIAVFRDPLAASQPSDLISLSAPLSAMLISRICPAMLHSGSPYLSSYSTVTERGRVRSDRLAGCLVCILYSYLAKEDK